MPEPETSPDSPVEIAGEKLEFYKIVREICVESGIAAETILSKDTINYFNVSYNKPTFWFTRLFLDTKHKNITTLVPVEEATKLASGFKIEQSPDGFGVSRIYINDVAQTRGLDLLLGRSLEILQAQKTGTV